MEWTIKGEYYTTTYKDITLKIKRNNLNKETHTFAYNTVVLYRTHETEIINYALKGIASSYGYSEINNNLIEKFKNPTIEITSNEDGIIFWINFIVDNKIVSCKFKNDFNLLNVKISEVEE